MKPAIPQGLYLITDDEKPVTLLNRTEAALHGGARIVQFRSKTLEEKHRIELGRALQRLCRSRNALFLVNDEVRLARQLQADGVHLGQNDGSVAEARAVLGEHSIIGRSTRTLDQVREAAREGADYIGFGSVFPTGSKRDAQLVGLEALKQACAASELPVVAIGGIQYGNATLAIEAGAHNVAVISAVMADRSPSQAARELELLFLRNASLPRGVVLSVAGSDSGGGAGIQADIKTLSLIGTHAATAITALTAQNSLGVQAVHAVPGPFVCEQVRSVTSDLGADLIKTGMLCSAEAVSAVARAVDECGALLVCDPVLASSSGTPLLSDEGVTLLKRELLPRTYLVTPNLDEAARLTGIDVRNRASMEEAGRSLLAMGARNVLIKGGHLGGEPLDLLMTRHQTLGFTETRIENKHSHGTGCTLASAIAAWLCQGVPLSDAIRRAKRFVTAGISTARALGSGTGPVNSIEAARVLGVLN